MFIGASLTFPLSHNQSANTATFNCPSTRNEDEKKKLNVDFFLNSPFCPQAGEPCRSHTHHMEKCKCVYTTTHTHTHTTWIQTSVHTYSYIKRVMRFNRFEAPVGRLLSEMKGCCQV